ncbi:prepilin peptidase [Microbacterium proteolyticum]|uniref:prepilin peptidase n=1 Tax=Microbacterium proteolyticum TaxID=1572644 RepID=UPI0035C0EA37
MLGVALVVFGALSLVLAVIDLRHHRLPHILVLPGLACALALLTSAALTGAVPERLTGVWAAAAFAFVVLLALHRARPSDIGGGDVTLAALAGAHLGWFGWDAVVTGLGAGVICGGAAAVGTVLAGARGIPIALGPPLLMGTWWALLGAMW